VAVTIGSNILSLKIKQELDTNSSSLNKVYERLSSGMRINHASDDAAGLAVATSLNANAKIYTKAVRNINDGISYLNIADSAVGSLKDITTRMRELSTEAANGILADTQRTALNNEFQTLGQEYNRILETTKFNGVGVLLRESGTITIQAGYGSSGAINISLQTTNAASADTISAMSVAPDGTIGNGMSTESLTNAGAPVISADGRFLVFTSNATNLVAGVTDGLSHIFMRDRLSGQTSVIDTTASGQLANAPQAPLQFQLMVDTYHLLRPQLTYPQAIRTIDLMYMSKIQ